MDTERMEAQQAYVADRMQANAKKLRFNVACHFLEGMLANHELVNEISWDGEFLVGGDVLVELSYDLADKMIAKMIAKMNEETRSA